MIVYSIPHSKLIFSQWCCEQFDQPQINNVFVLTSTELVLQARRFRPLSMWNYNPLKREINLRLFILFHIVISVEMTTVRPVHR